jgi:hypothetical protein
VTEIVTLPFPHKLVYLSDKAKNVDALDDKDDEKDEDDEEDEDEEGVPGNTAEGGGGMVTPRTTGATKGCMGAVKMWSRGQD